MLLNREVVAAPPWEAHIAGFCFYVVRKDMNILRFHERAFNPKVDISVFILTVILLFFGRLRCFSPDIGLSFDEAVFIARAMALVDDPIFWRSVHGTSAGPLIHYPIALLIYLGAPLDFRTMAGLSVACYAIALSATYVSLIYLVGRSVALAATIPFIVLLSFTREADFLQYNSETLPVLLALVGVMFCEIFHAKQPLKIRYLLLAGCFFGLIPWAKLQAAPFAATLIGIYGLRLTLKLKQDASSTYFNFLKRITILPSSPISLTALLVGTIVPTLAGSVVLFRYGLIEEAWFTYVQSNLYLTTTVVDARTGGFLGRLQVVKAVLLSRSTFLIPLLFTSYSIWLFFRTVRCGQIRLRQNIFLFTSAFTLFSCCLFVFVASGKGYPHYLIYAIFPLLFMLAAILGSMVLRERLFLVSALTLCGALCPLIQRDEVASDYQEPKDVTEVANYLRGTTKGEKLAVWAVTPWLYAATGLAPTTREIKPDFAFYPGVAQPIRDLFEARFVEDMRRKKTSLVIQAATIPSWDYVEPGLRKEDFPLVQKFLEEGFMAPVEVGGFLIYRAKKDKNSPLQTPERRRD